MLVFGAQQGLAAELPRFVWPCGRRTEAQPQTQLSGDDAKRLIDAAEPDWRAMIALALAGLRLGELLGLRWANVDLAKRRAAIRWTLVRGIAGPPERGRPRKITLDEHAVAALHAHPHDRGRLVFCDEYGAPLTPEQTHWPLWRARDRAGLPRMGWDELRRRHAEHGDHIRVQLCLEPRQ